MAQNHLNMCYGGGASTSYKPVVSIAPWVTANGASAYVEVGHTDVFGVTPTITKVKFASEQSHGPLINATQENGFTLDIPALEMRLDLLKVAWDQLDSALSGNTLLVGDAADREWTIRYEVKGPGATPNSVETYWRCVRESCGKTEFGKASLQKLPMQFTVLTDNTSTLGSLARIANSA